MSRIPLLTVFGVVSIVAAASSAARDPYVPPELESWRAWVLDDDPRIVCPIAAGEGGRACLWPGRLDVEIERSGGRFEQTVEVLAPAWFVLPGDSRTWPRDVTVDGDAVAVTPRQERPAVYLDAGRYRVRGAFAWPTVPDSLGLSALTGMLSLTVDGQSVAQPRWDRNTLWTGGGQTEAATQSENRILVTVYRTINDGAPAYMDVTLQINVSGESREEVIGRLVAQGFVPASMTSPLPARLDSDGQLRIQARPGNWTLTFRGRTSGPLTALTFEPDGAHWPEEEIWSFRADPRLRVTEASADNPIDPQQAGVPTAVADLPAFRMRAGDTLTIDERQRGRAPTERDRLSLTRELWLDFARGGFTAKDTIQGQMLNDWRLDLAAPFALQSAAIGRSVAGNNLLITTNPTDESLRGVEIRTPKVALTTLSRLDQDGGRLPVSGWQTRMQRVTTQLYLPPGTRLLYASGADSDRSSWVNQWNLLHFFLLLIIATALWRMYHPLLGITALVALTLTMHESGAPLWTWVSLIVALALCRALPEGRLRRSAVVYKYLSVAAIVLTILPFAAHHLRLALYPQLEHAGGQFSLVDFDAANQAQRDSATMPVPAAPPPDRNLEFIQVEEEADSLAARARKSGMAGPRRLIDAASSPQVLNRYAKNAQVQTGPGTPNWRWRSYALNWSGPVTAAQTMHLWIAPPWVMSVWRVAMVAIVLVLLGALLRRDLARPGKPPAGAAAAVLALVTALVVAPSAPTAHAQMPPQSLLDDLKVRLTRPAECVPQCVDIERAAVRYAADTLRVDLIAHAQAAAVLDLPGASNGWYPTGVTVDGRQTEALRLANGRFQTRLASGVHRIELRGALPNANTVTLAFPLVPRHVTVDGEGWEATGYNDNKLSGGALTLIRQRTAEAAGTLAAIDVEQFPAFVTVTRTLDIDLDWTVTTQVLRNTPPSAAINVRIPLLPGEAVVSDGVEVEDGAAIVNLATGQPSIIWNSTLARTTPLTVSAETGVPWQERWNVNVGPSWRLSHRGVPEDNTDVLQSAFWTAAFTPWPGEALELDIRRPDAVAGPTLAIDHAQLLRRVGRRSSESTLTLGYRATQGGQHVIGLPAGSELISVQSNGRTLHLTAQDDRLRLPIVPGQARAEIRWRRAADLGALTRSEAVDLGSPASNLTSTIELPASRWMLWTSGPRLGPAVLYWSELLVLVLVAVVLARLAKTPLRFHHWLLLGLGFSTFFWPSFAIVAAAILALWLRERHALERPLAFNLVQVLLAGLVLIAAGALVSAIPLGLLGSPDMHVTGNGSYAGQLNWFVDRSDAAMPIGRVVSLPLWVYKGLILVWALWLAFALLRWLPWMWRAYTRDGYWKPLRRARGDGDADPSAGRSVEKSE